MTMKFIKNTNVFYEVIGETLLIGGKGAIPSYSIEEYEEEHTCWINNYPDENEIFPNFEKAPWLQQKNTIEKLVIMEGVESIGSGAFECMNALKMIELPSSIRQIGNYAFANCTTLKTITIPPLVTEISANTFDGCVELERVTLPTKLKSIEMFAFRGCKNLASIHIPKFINDIDFYAFDGCSNLENIWFDGTIEQWGELSSERFGKARVAPNIICTSEPSKRFTSTKIICSLKEQKNGDVLVLDESKTILLYCQRSFSGEVSIPSTVKNIQERAFSGCKHITSVFIPNTVVNIGDFCFEDCSSLKKIRLSFVEKGNEYIHRRLESEYPDLIFEIE